MSPAPTRIEQQLNFVIEADKLKSINRSNVLMDLSRPENTGEHCWHVALWALVLGGHAKPGTDISRAIAMVLVHDLVEIDAGDHPIHEEADWDAVARAELAGADRIFGILPDDQAAEIRALWDEFEARQTPTAQFAKWLDFCQPILQVLDAPEPRPDHLIIARENITTGRAHDLDRAWPEMHDQVVTRLEGHPLPDTDLTRQLAFLAEADNLKSVLRATTLCDGSRRENSAEHSWHLALFGLIFGEHGPDAARVITMLLLHDLVEIDAGDTPIHGVVDQAAQDALEAAAADRIFGLLPDWQNAELRAIWEEFEAAQSEDAVFAKSLDRVQPVICNLMSGGGSWVDYKVTFEQLESRVAHKVRAGFPLLWDTLEPSIRDWFAQNTKS